MSFGRGSFVIWNGILSEVIEETESEGTYTLECTHPITGDLIREDGEESEFVYLSNIRREQAFCIPQESKGRTLYAILYYRPRAWVNQYSREAYHIDKTIINEAAMPGMYEIFLTMAANEQEAIANFELITDNTPEKIDCVVGGNVSSGNNLVRDIERALLFNWGAMQKWDDLIDKQNFPYRPSRWSDHPILLSSDQLFSTSFLMRDYLAKLPTINNELTEEHLQPGDSPGDDELHHGASG